MVIPTSLKISPHPTVDTPMADAEYLEINDRAWERFRGIPGVHAVGIGAKQVGGRRTSELAIAVFVIAKKSVDQLPEEEVIPSTIEGVRTDVVEMRMPRTAGSPVILPLVDKLDPPRSGALIMLTSTEDPDPVPKGLMVVVTVTTTSIAPPQTSESFFSFLATTDLLTVASMATKLADDLVNQPNVTVTNPGIAQILIEAGPAHTAAVNCYVAELDTKEYSDFLRGGVRIECSEPGTLACLATLASGQVVAITNQHIAATPRTGATNLRSSTSTNPTRTITVKRSDALSVPIAPGSLLRMEFNDASTDDAFAFYTTKPGDELPAIGQGLADAINGASIPGLHATLRPGAAIVDPAVLDVTTASATHDLETTATGPALPDPTVRLHADILPAAGGTKLLSFDGQAPAKEHYGVFVRLNAGGRFVTFGIFFDPAGKTPTGVATEVATAINRRDALLHGPLVATPFGAVVKIDGAQEVECLIQSDVRIGQPTNFMAWPCSQEIGHVLDARLDVDAAVIQLKPGVKYKQHIEEIGVVDGFLPLSALSVGFPVQKRGHASGLTTGIITHTNIAGGIEGQSSSGVNTFRRCYRGAIKIESTTRHPATGTLKPFILPGDSGSALVTAGPAPVKVVGLIFASGDSTDALATPIERVINAFPALGLSFALAPGLDPNAVQTVPGSAFQAIDGRLAPDFAGANVAPLGMRRPAFLRERMIEVERQVTATRAGRAYAEVIKHHFAEARTLVNNNRRVGTVWRRSGGPEIMNRILEMMFSRDQRLPTEINGRPFAECLERIQRILLRYASPAFSNDLSRVTPGIAQWSGMTYGELLATFQRGQTE
jgi:hypothetical protein